MRGYRYLKKNNNLSFVSDLKRELSKCSLNVNNEKKNKSLKQFIFQNIFTTVEFNQEVLHSLGSNKSISFPLPHDWQIAIINKGLKLNKTSSSILWQLKLAKYFLKGSIVFLILIFKSFQTILRGTSNKKHSFIYGLTDDCLPDEKEELNEVYNTANWFIKWAQIKNDYIIYHNVGSKKIF